MPPFVRTGEVPRLTWTLTCDSPVTPPHNGGYGRRGSGSRWTLIGSASVPKHCRKMLRTWSATAPSISAANSGRGSFRHGPPRTLRLVATLGKPPPPIDPERRRPVPTVPATASPAGSTAERSPDSARTPRRMSVPTSAPHKPRQIRGRRARRTPRRRPVAHRRARPPGRG
jgi:hypothetical protein